MSILFAELAILSPLLHKIFRSMHAWQEDLGRKVESYGPPPVDYISGCFVDKEAKGPAIQKYHSLLQYYNTPFNQMDSSARPARRLWSFLVRQENVQDVFVRAIFSSRQRSARLSRQEGGGSDFGILHDIATKEMAKVEPIRIIHKDQESIAAFCISKTETGLLALATPKELQEIDATLLLQSNRWLEDECELDIINLNKDTDNTTQSSYLIVHTPQDV